VVRYASVLHDIGKVGIPDAILNKPGKLDENEWEFMRRHPRIGADIVDQIEGFEEISAAIIAHHERYDGGGYPFGLKGEEIPIEARIISVVDTYDAMTSDRPYRRALSHDTAIAELSRCAGTQFDTRVVEAFCSMGLRDLKEREDD
jgi:HD-GYP domain-containing protein (c-di-GMP phosphodiesterase class II)